MSKHGIATLHGDLNNNNKVFNMAIESCQKAGFSIVGTYIHNFYPQGCSAVVALGESHFTVHTYPEEDYCYVDCFTCNPEQNPGEAIYIFKKIMSLKGVVNVINR